MAYEDTIRLYRGNKSGLPTVLDGEPVWAHDTGELYVGGRYGNVRIGYGITPEAYGAKGDGTTDDTTALNNAAAAATAAGAALAFGAGKTYLITDTLTIQCDTLDFGAEIDVSGAPTNAIIIGGPETGTTYAAVYWGWRDGHKVYLPKVKNLDKPTTGWATGCGTGVMLRNVFESEIHLNWIYGFDIGLRCYGVNTGSAIGGGTCHNHIFLGHIEDCKIGVQLDKGANGFTNENNFYGGRFNIQSAEGSEIAGTRYLQLGLSTAFGCNNNCFYKPSLEGDGPEYQIEFYGSLNHIAFARWEVTSVLPKVHFGESGADYSNGNVLFYGYGANFTVTSDATCYNNIIYNREGNAIESSQTARSTLTLANAAGADYSSLRIVDATERPWGDHSADYSYDWTARYFKAKQNGDTYPRLQIDANDGSISFGDGTAAPGVALSSAEMTYLDGQNQYVKTTSDVQFDFIRATNVAPTSITDGAIPYMSAPQKITDGGLENWASATDLTSWTEIIAGTSSVNQETSVVHGGSNCLRIDVDASNSEARIYQAFTLETSTLYRLNFWYKNASGKTIDWQITDSGTNVYLNSTTGLFQASPTATAPTSQTDWTEVEAYFTTHGTYTSYHFYVGEKFGSGASSSNYIDDISIVKVVGLADSPMTTDGTDVDNSGVYKVDGVQVVGNQGAAVADATGAGDVVAQLNALLARLRTHGLIAT
jgi:hypothetical protein